MRLAYDFLSEDLTTGDYFTTGEGDEPAWAPGEERVYAGEIEPRVSGYHCAPTLYDALAYAPGPVACLVEISDPIEFDEDQDDGPLWKIWVSKSRKLIKFRIVARELRLFAADCAERVLYIFERERPDDKRPRLAIEAARDFANGKIETAALAFAETAARAAASAIAFSGMAPASAARAAEGATASAAERAAAWAGGWAAASAATLAAARDPARFAEGMAAGAAERKWQRDHFNEMFQHLFD